MKILREKLFREENKESKKKIDKKDLKLGGAIIGGGIVGNTAAALNVIDLEKLSDGSIKMPKYLKPKQIDAEENKMLIEKLKTAAKKKGIKFGEGDLGGNPACYERGKKTVYMDSRANPGADILSHELGHAHYDNDKSANKLGKLAHEGFKKANGMDLFIKHGPLAGIGAGVASGIVKAKKEEKGKKEGIVNKTVPYLTPVVVTSPGLVSEVAASAHGLKLLKKAGASKKALKAARRNLGHAAMSYGTYAAIGAGLGGVSKHIAYRTTKKIDEKKKSKE